MKTSDLEQVISAYVDGEIPESKRAAVELLVQNNEQAAACYNDFIRIRQGLRAIPTVELPADFANNVIAAIKQKQMSKTDTSKPGYARVFRIRRLVISGTISLCVIAVAAGLFIWSASPGTSTHSGRVTAMVPANVQSANHNVTPASQPETVASEPAQNKAESKKYETQKNEKNWITAPVPLAVQKNDSPKITKPTLDALLWVHCTPVASQDKKFADEFAKYCMSKSLNFTVTGQRIYKFKMSRSDFNDFIQWLRQNPLTGGDVQVSDALTGWAAGHTSYSMPLDQTEGLSQDKPTMPMADELFIRLQINSQR